MPVTHGVAGSSPVRTAEILKRKFRDFLFSVASPQPSNIRFCGNRQKSAKQPSKQRDAPPGKSTTYGSRNPDSTDIGEVHNVDSLSANPGRGPGHMDDTDKKKKGLSRNLVGINFRHPNVMPNFAVWKTITYRHWHKWCCQPRF